jgi:predicted alpha/beta-hydrolase family hydrolase
MKHIQIAFRDGQKLTASLDLPQTSPKALVVLAHGSSSLGKELPLLADLASAMSQIGLACLRFDFPFVCNGKKTPNSEAVLIEAYGAALAEGRRQFPGIPVIAAGKSLGAKIALRMPAAGLAGAILFGFPLHAPGHAGTAAASLLREFLSPILIIQGTRDAFANKMLLRDVVGDLPHTSLYQVEGGDHSLRCAVGLDASLPGIISAIKAWLVRKIC